MHLPSEKPFYAPGGGISITPEWWEAGWRIRDVSANQDVLIIVPPRTSTARPDFEVFVFHQVVPAMQCHVLVVVTSPTHGIVSNNLVVDNVMDPLQTEIDAMNVVVCGLIKTC